MAVIAREEIVPIISSSSALDEIVKSFNYCKGVSEDVRLRQTCQYCSKFCGCCLKDGGAVAMSPNYHCDDILKEKS